MGKILPYTLIISDPYLSHSESATKLWQADESTRGRRARQKLGSVHEPVPLIFPSSFDHHRKSDHILTKKPMPESCCARTMNLQSGNAYGGAFPSDVTNNANRAPRSDQTRLVWPAANQKLRRCYLSHALPDLGTPSFRSKFTSSLQFSNSAWIHCLGDRCLQWNKM